MRYNETIQRKADTFAKRQGYFCAVYLGPTDDSLIFAPRFDDNEPRCTGLPTFIIYRNGRLHLDVGLDFCKFEGRRLRYHYTPRKGKLRFEVYRQMYDYDTFYSDKDKELVSEIVAMARGGYEASVSLREIYEALEIAERFDMTIEFYPDPSTTDRLDSWHYFIRIVPGHLPERLYIIID